MAGGGEKGEASLEETPTYAVAAVVAAFVFVSVAAERGIHHLGLWLKQRRRWKSIYKALERMKEELMLLGFISLLLTAFQVPVTRICVPKYSSAMMPCGNHNSINNKEDAKGIAEVPSPASESHHGRRLLAGESTSVHCPEGKQPFLSAEGLHQLHIFIFILAIVHIVYSCITMGLALYQIHGWKKWEERAKQLIDECHRMTDKERMDKMALRRQSTFLRRHTSNSRIFDYHATNVIMCFMRQFWNAVHGADYRTLRLAFIMSHDLDFKFNFHRYIIRSMEEDFQTIVGISWHLWFFVIVYTLLNIISWQFYFIIAAISWGGVCLLGTKLVYIMFTLAKEAKDQAGVVGIQLEVRDNLFWFSRPSLILTLLHLILFTNAFEISTFIFYAWQFGVESCFLGGYGWVIARLIISLAVQVQCSYITLPLYALITHMGSHWKAAIFSDNTQSTIKAWVKKVKKKRDALSYFQDLSTHLQTVTSTIHNTAHDLADSIQHAKSIHLDRIRTRNNVNINNNNDNKNNHTNNNNASHLDRNNTLSTRTTNSTNSTNSTNGANSTRSTTDVDWNDIEARLKDEAHGSSTDIANRK